ncbi:MAG: hypothetical protein ACPGVP_16385 [Thiolinea sp.]
MWAGTKKLIISWFRGLLLLLPGLLIFVSSAAIADDRLRILPLERQLIADQRGIISLRFEVENRTGVAQEVYETMQLPPRWNLITTPVPFSLQPNQREIRLLHILIPGDSPAGSFPVTYRLTSTSDINLQQLETVTITIARKASNQLDEVSRPPNLLPGESYEVLFQLFNTGNTTQTYSVRVRNSDGTTQNLGTNTINLTPNGSETITVKGRIPDDFRPDNHQFELAVYSNDESLERQVSIPVISLNPEGVGTHHELQGQLRLGFSATDNEEPTDYNTSVEYKARGSLDADGNHQIAVQVNSGYRSSDPYQGMVQQYKLAYEHENWQAKAGHQNFYTDRLVGNHINGEGIEIAYRPKDKNGLSTRNVRAFYAESHDDAEQSEKAMALVAKHRFTDQQLEVGATLLHHETNPGQADKTEKDIAGLNARWSGDAANFYAGVAHDGEHQAVGLEGNVHQGNISANLSYLHSDPEFQGANPDGERIYLASQWRLDERTRINASARETRTNLAADNSHEIRRDTEHQVRLNRSLGLHNQTQIGVGLRQRHNRDMRDQSTTNHEIHTGLLSYQHKLDAINIKAQLEAGKRRDQISGQPNSETKGSRQQLTMSWRPDRKTLFSTDFNRQKGLDNDYEARSLGIRGQYQLDNKTKLSGYIQHHFGEQETSTRANVKLDKELHQQRRISVQLTHQQNNGSATTQDKEKSLYIDYVMPLDVPLRRRTDIATVCGRMVHAHSNTPAAAMVLQLGPHTTVADRRGRFCFPNVLAKTYQLQLDISRLKGESYILGMEGTSRTVTLDPGEEQNLKITLHPAARVQGMLRRLEIDLETALVNNSHLKAGAGITNITMNLTPIDHPHLKPLKRVTDAQGNFNILGIPPGKWRLSVANPEKLPKHYFLEQNNWELDLQAGQTETLSINAVPAQQHIEKTGPGGGFSVEG